jgi:polysaccharide pyruvyl transferase WcaK-like protein
MTAPRILIGGVPFGCDNVGDEAILECIVGILRHDCPDARLSVSTNDGPATARKLGVETLELFGFGPPYSRARMAAALRSHDVFIWGGATGLSDYPEIPLRMLQLARAAGRTTVLWGVGMNSELNPVWYTVLPGRRRTVLQWLSRCTGGRFDAVRAEEQRREGRARRRIYAELSQASLVVLRDEPSRREVQRCGGPLPQAIVGADSALLLEPTPLEQVRLPEAARQFLAAPGRKIGLCVSAQREIRDRAGLVALLDRLVAGGDTRLVFVPMNPITDALLMRGLRDAMRQPERALVVEGRYEPGEILTVAGTLDVVAASRLHLLILASILHVPIIGISRGSKVDNFLEPFGLTSVGSVESCDFGRLEGEFRRLLDDRAGFERRSRQVRQELLTRLERARVRLREVLGTAPAAAAGAGGQG